MTSSLRAAAVLAIVCLACALLLGSAGSTRAERERPPPGYTGGFSEPVCQACHFQADVNAGTGTLAIDGLPVEYRMDTAYTLTITLTQQGLGAGGFQMSSRFEHGAQAGHL
ncbi:MAG: choice-of-anchor V domain-containing protein, partial [Longimicrobiales bacterium]